MDKLTKLFVKVTEREKGQTMAEYALIMAAVAVIVFVAYQKMGTTITTLLEHRGQPALIRASGKTLTRRGHRAPPVQRPTMAARTRAVGLSGTTKWTWSESIL